MSELEVGGERVSEQVPSSGGSGAPPALPKKPRHHCLAEDCISWLTLQYYLKFVQ